MIDLKLSLLFLILFSLTSASNENEEMTVKGGNQYCIDGNGGMFGGGGGYCWQFKCPYNEQINAFGWINHRTNHFWQGWQTKWLKAVRFRCNNSGWGQWFGSVDNNQHTWYANGKRINEFHVRSGSMVDALGFTSVTGSFSGIQGNDEGGMYHHRVEEKETYLRGMKIRSGTYIDAIGPIWQDYLCPQFFNLNSFSYYTASGAHDTNKNGYYQKTAEFFHHHAIYKQIVQDDVAPATTRLIFRKYNHWYVGPNTDTYWLKIKDAGVCAHMTFKPQEWEYWNGEENKHFSYPPSVSAPEFTPFVFGKPRGFWLNVGSDGIMSWSNVMTRIQQSTTTEEAQHKSAWSKSHTVGGEVKFKVSGSPVSGSATYERNWSQSAENIFTSSLQNTFSSSVSDGTYCSPSQSTLTNGFTVWVWSVNRFNNLGEEYRTNTCNFKIKFGDFQHIPPNCFPGTCSDMDCVNCTSDEFKIDLSLTEPNEEVPEKDCDPTDPNPNWNCCAELDHPCNNGEGHCWNNDECAEGLICGFQNGIIVGPSAHVNMNVCVSHYTNTPNPGYNAESEVGQSSVNALEMDLDIHDIDDVEEDDDAGNPPETFPVPVYEHSTLSADDSPDVNMDDNNDVVDESNVGGISASAASNNGKKKTFEFISESNIGGVSIGIKKKSSQEFNVGDSVAEIKTTGDHHEFTIKLIVGACVISGLIGGYVLYQRKKANSIDEYVELIEENE